MHQRKESVYCKMYESLRLCEIQPQSVAFLLEKASQKKICSVTVGRLRAVVLCFGRVVSLKSSSPPPLAGTPGRGYVGVDWTSPPPPPSPGAERVRPPDGAQVEGPKPGDLLHRSLGRPQCDAGDREDPGAAAATVSGARFRSNLVTSGGISILYF